MQVKKQVLFLGSFLLSLTLSSCSQTQKQATGSEAPLRVGIAPYQELSLMVNEKPLGLEQKYGTKVEVLTMPWEDLLPAVASAGPTIDVGFAGMSDYLAQAKNLNSKGDDRVLYLYPSWNFHGGALISFNKNVPELNAQTVKDKELVKKFFSYKIGVQKDSCYHLLLWKLARQNGIDFKNVHILEATLNDGFLAAENGSLDVAGAGLTQRTETTKRGGRIVLTMDTLDVVQPAAFICKESLFKRRKKDVEAVIRMWYDCSHYVLSDLDHHSEHCLTYLKTNASTKYTLDEFKRALAQEYVPQSIAEANRVIVHGHGPYSNASSWNETNQYLIDMGLIKTALPLPKMLQL